MDERHPKRFIVDDYENGCVLSNQTLREVIEGCTAMSDSEIGEVCTVGRGKELDFGGYTVTRTA